MAQGAARKAPFKVIPQISRTVSIATEAEITSVTTFTAPSTGYVTFEVSITGMATTTPDRTNLLRLEYVRGGNTLQGPYDTALETKGSLTKATWQARDIYVESGDVWHLYVLGNVNDTGTTVTLDVISTGRGN